MAAEQRQRAAHGVSRGLGFVDSEPRSGERKAIWKAEFYRPFLGLWFFCPVPTAFAVGYYLPPLRGWLQGSFPLESSWQYVKYVIMPLQCVAT